MIEAAIHVPTTAAFVMMTVGITPPSAIVGSWVDEGARACASDTRMSFRPDGAELSKKACAYDGIRALHKSRWYVDLNCAHGKYDLDINRLDADRLMIAERPLGVASIYRRCS